MPNRLSDRRSVGPNPSLGHRDRLLAGLATVLESMTLAELYTSDIVREAGVSKRTFYMHFRNKEECFLALYESNYSRILAVLGRATLGQGISMIQCVESGVVAYLTAMQRQAALMKRLYIDIMSLGTEGMAARRRVFQSFADQIGAIYDAERARTPSMPPLPSDLLLGVIAALNELILYKIEDGESEQLLNLVETTRVMVLGVVEGQVIEARRCAHSG